MAELEASCKYNLRQLMLAKVVIAALVNIICNSALSLAIAGLYTDVNPSRMFFYWCLPFVVISSVSLIITIRIKGYHTSLACIGFWTAFSIFITGEGDFMEFLVYHAGTGALAFSTFVSLIFMVTGIVYIFKKSFERGDLFDIDNGKYNETI